MKRKIVKTADGSSTISVPELNEHYHSVNGAIAEANHVYINAGYKNVEKDKISILEIGFGTGLNSLLTLIQSVDDRKYIFYQGVEAYPVSLEELSALNYLEELKADEYEEKYKLMHTSPWDEKVEIAENFVLLKEKKSFTEIEDIEKFDLIYFDAFGPDVQPDLWTEDIFKKMYDSLKPNGILVTYSSKGIVKRALRSVGFTVKRLDGPKGKRHMLRASNLS
jgi:tRNA U34 5-methylaminomethyl-2-thiouridine-forming methyltransferase MnmC